MYFIIVYRLHLPVLLMNCGPGLAIRSRDLRGENLSSLAHSEFVLLSGDRSDWLLPLSFLLLRLLMGGTM